MSITAQITGNNPNSTTQNNAARTIAGDKFLLIAQANTGRSNRTEDDVNYKYKVDNVYVNGAEYKDMGARTFENLRTFLRSKGSNADLIRSDYGKETYLWSNVKKQNLKAGYVVSVRFYSEPNIKKDKDGYIEIDKNSKIPGSVNYSILLRRNEVLLDLTVRDLNGEHYGGELKLKGSIDFRFGLDNLYFVPNGKTFKDAVPLNPMIANEVKATDKRNADRDEKWKLERQQEKKKEVCGMKLPGLGCTGIRGL